MYYVLFNAKAAGGTGEKTARKLEEILKDEELVFKSVHDMDYRSFFAEVDPEAKVVLVGGDGTLNYFVNDIRRVDVKNEIYFFAGGKQLVRVLDKLAALVFLCAVAEQPYAWIGALVDACRIDAAHYGIMQQIHWRTINIGS